MNPRALVALLLGIALAGAGPARAGTEEFSTFDVEAPEQDDESLLDHTLTRMPRAWRDEWERSPQALRTAQGCLTSGQWFIDTDLKLQAPLGRRARFRLDVRQSETDLASYQYLDFSFQFPTRYGAPGLMFRPLYDKSRQDFALTWELGADTTTHQVIAAFGLEDLFNNFWAFRQTRVGRDSEPYERHPYEPALRVVSRHARWRAEIAGRWLTPARKRMQGLSAGAPERRVSLWGTLASATLEVDALGVVWQAATVNRQALGTDQPIDLSTAENRNFRRLWTAELHAHRALTPGLDVQARWIYQAREQHYGPPYGPGLFESRDRLLAVEAAWELDRHFGLRFGALNDRIHVARSGRTTWDSYGTRTESRAFLGVGARFGRVRLQIVEGIELDPEPYDVWGVHDKGFFHLQATF